MNRSRFAAVAAVALLVVASCQDDEGPFGTPNTGTGSGSTATGVGTTTGSTTGSPSGTASGSGGTGSGVGGGTAGAGGEGVGGSAGGAQGGGGVGGGVSCPPSTAMMINEVNYDVPGDDAGKEWIELYNASATSVNVSGWQVEAGAGSYGVRFTFPQSTVVASHAYVVVGGADVTGADFNSPTALNMGNVSGSADAVRLVTDTGAVIDTVIYGAPAPNTDQWVDDCGDVASSYAPGGTSSQVIARSPNGVDTNDSGDDFVATNNATMGAANP